MRRRPRRTGRALLCGALVLLASPAAATAAAERRSFVADADTYVTSASPAGAFGDGAQLRVDAAPVARAYLRFDVELPAGATVTGAVLRLHATSAGAAPGVTVHPVAETTWAESALTFADAPPAGAELAASGGWAAGASVTVDLPAGAVRPGRNAFALATASRTGEAFASRETADPPQLDVIYDAPGGAAVTVLAAGDIQPRTTSSPTAPLLSSAAPDAILTLGDNQYETGTLDEFNAFYSHTWGTAELKPRTYPAPGNHERISGLAANYCAYFRTGANGAAAVDPCPSGVTYYSFDLGAWHLVALDSSAGTIDATQRAWLRADLAANPAPCTLAYWHHPRYSGGLHGSHRLDGVWGDLMAAGGDVVLAGHDHNYQRFARMDDAGSVDPVGGIRSFVVGTGGKSHYATTAIPGQEVADVTTHGVLRLTLAPGSYTWTFLPEAGKTFTDAGMEACH